MLHDRLLLQQRELNQKFAEFYVPREIVFPLGQGLIKVLIGPRRAGKSTSALHWLRQQGAAFGYCNFDDEELVTVKDYQELVTELGVIYQQPRWLFFDEIQNLPNWELFVNRLQRQGYQLLLTGSNAHLLNRELATHLTGRHQQVIVFPFSFREFLKRRKEELTTHEIQQELQLYLQKGGFPEPLFKNLEEKEYLSTLYNSILYKDIVRRWNIRSYPALDNLSSYLFSTVAGEFSLNALRKITGIKSTLTLEKYLHALEEAFLFFRVPRFSFKARQIATLPKKIYSVDLGFIQAKAFTFTQNLGKIYENAVAIKLKKSELEGKLAFFYWKNQQQEEVDFVIKKRIRITQLIQVCVSLLEPRTWEREIRALLKASRDLHCKNLLIITKEKEGKEKASWFGIEGEVSFIPLWKWLLQENDED